MKKPNAKKRRRDIAAAHARWQHNLNRSDKPYDPNKLPKIHSVLGQKIIMAPENISIYDLESEQADYIRTIEFLESIEKHVGSGKNCCLDFSNTERVTAAALVLVYATIDTANRPHKKVIGYGAPKSSNRVSESIKKSNLPKLLRAQEFQYALEDARHIPIVSSTGREQFDEILDYIQQRIFNDQMSPETEHIYGDAISETINNVGLHAYPSLPNDQKRWWLTCSTYGKKLYLAIYDQGVGIPETVVSKPWLLGRLSKTDPTLHAELLRLYPGKGQTGLAALIPKKIPDEKLIHLSMQGDVTGTQKDKHGQGSKSIMALVSDTSDGLLWVFSNNGVFTFDQEDRTPGVAKLRKKFPGTLIQWNIEIP